MPLHELSSANTPRKRVGRGGKRGKTSGKGTKGQKSRAGGTPRPAWRDIIKKIPKLRGHGINRARTVNPNAPVVQGVTLRVIAANYTSGETVSPLTLMEKGILDRGVSSIKILATGEINTKLSFDGVDMTAQALEKIEASGSTIIEE